MTVNNPNAVNFLVVKIIKLKVQLGEAALRTKEDLKQLQQLGLGGLQGMFTRLQKQYHDKLYQF